MVSHSGSRYTSSASLITLQDYLNNDEKYCFIGKPCDVTILRNWLDNNENYKFKFPYMLSFFCAGAPSRIANEKKIKKKGTSIEETEDLEYRGNGWPGLTTATSKNGKTFTLPYREAWGNTLGRDIRKICRFCLDGIGELADVSCCDAWYLNEKKLPDFSEHSGRNAVFCRTEIGNCLFLDAVKHGYITITGDKEYEQEMRYSQYHQYFKRGTMISSIIALKIMRRSYPLYSTKFMREISKNVPLGKRIRKMAGTIKRIYEKKI